jgi:nicotinate-nucleotide adenylyltransferase
MSETGNIALFGGTFDPVHLGHIHIAEAARNALPLDEVRFIPCRVSPFKTANAPTRPEDRMEMLRLATRDLTWAVVDDFEVKREGPSYSWQTAGAMKARFPNSRLFWIMGTDQWELLPDWAHPEKLAACVEFIVFSRGSTPQPREGYRLHVVHAVHPASASGIREAIQRGGGKPEWLHPDVARLIEERGLYRR